MASLERAVIYTDGACLSNPGPGGYGVVVLQGDGRRELSGGFRLTTNNRMEVTAAIVGLEALEGRSVVTLYSDSKYLVDGITLGWAKRWRSNGWMRNAKERAINPDLWEKLLDLCSQHEVEFRWVKGHASNKENSRCDALSVQAARQKGLPSDCTYEKGESARPLMPLFFD